MFISRQTTRLSSMDVTVLMTGPATATLRWMLKVLRSEPGKFTTDDLRADPDRKLHIPLRTQSNEYVGALVLDFLLEMPSLDAFRLLNYDAVVFITDESDSSNEWKLHTLVNRLGCDFYVANIRNPQSGSKFPIAFSVDGEICATPDELIGATSRPTIVRRAKEMNDAATTQSSVQSNTTETNIDTSNVPEIKITEPADTPDKF